MNRRTFLRMTGLEFYPVVIFTLYRLRRIVLRVKGAA